MSVLFERRGERSRAMKVSPLQKLLSWWLSHIRQATASLGDLWRTPIPSLMTILVLGFSLSLPAALYVVNKNGQQVAGQWKNPAQISMFLQKDQHAAQIQNLVETLKGWPTIAKVDWLSKDDALMEFKANSGFGNALNYLDENPLPDVLIITPADGNQTAEQAQLLLQKLQALPTVALAKLDIQWLERLNAMLGLLKNTFSGLATLLCLSVVLIIGNTIRLAILSRKNEIEVMKLVGATDAFIQRPFLYSGIWYGLFGAFLSWMVIAILLWWLESAVNHLTQLYNSPVHLIGLTGHESLLLMAISATMGLVGSWFSVHQHIRAIEPI